jgi:hypothetical protein
VLALIALPLLASTVGTARSASAYDAEMVWDRVGAANRYAAYVRFVQGVGAAPTEPERSVSILASALPASGDDRAHLVLTDLPLGPTAIFTVTTRANGLESARSNEVRLTYAEVARYIDSDGDGLLDYEEDRDLDLVVDAGETNSQKADTDGDGLADLDELVRTGTDPTRRDSDGDGTADGTDTCNDIDHDGFGSAPSGPASCRYDNCPFISNPGQADADFDSEGDACDPCTNVGGQQDSPAGMSKLEMRSVLRDTTPGNDVLKFHGAFSLPNNLTFASLDPLTEGKRIVIAGADGSIILDAELPPGPLGTGPDRSGWRAGRKGFKYLDRSDEPIGGIIKVVIKDMGRKMVRGVLVKVNGKNGTYRVTDDSLPMKVEMVIGDDNASRAGACGEADFAADGRCSLSGGGRIVTCR